VSGQEAESRILFSVVLSDANIVFSRVLRDYVLYAMTHQLIRVRWSQAILDEAVRRMIEKVDGFDEASGERLVAAMNGTFPYSQVDMTEEASVTVADFVLVDDNDRHVIAAAVAAEATFVCSDDLTGFPPEVMTALGIEWVTADALFSTLVEEAPEAMLKVHRMAVSRLPGATDESTIVALRGAGAGRTADLMEDLLKQS